MTAFILFTMIFLHVLDDYYFQGCLANLKQKKYWEALPGYTEKYKNDYIVALLMHSFEWAFMIMLPLIVYHSFNINFTVFISYFILNVLIHAFVDNEKANKFTINLIQDQTVHIIQIFFTFIALIN